jgi:RNA polymerase sigma-70 factor, ECF subfamily
MSQLTPSTCAREADFARFYADHFPRLRSYCSLRFGAVNADELAQDVMERALRSFDVVAVAGDPWPWLRVVARNAGLNHARAASCHAVAIDHEELSDLPADASTWPEEKIERDEERMLVRSALERLTPGQRRVLEMRLEDNLDYDRIASLLGTNENAVRQQLFKARRAFCSAYTALQGRLPLVLPGLGVAGALRRAFARHSRAAMRTAATTTAFTAAVVSVTLELGLQIGGTASPVPAVAQVHAAHATTTRSGTTAAKPQLPKEQAPEVRTVPGEVVAPQVQARVANKPLAPGEHAALAITVKTPLGTVYYRDETTSDQVGPVCAAHRELCS